jgi:glycyl-tRNA synthetase alpha chain
MGEITYGLERLAMYIQGKESIFDIVWTDGPFGHRDLRRRVSSERGRAVDLQLREGRHRGAVRQFDAHEAACQLPARDKLALPAYEQMVKASHAFNLLDARHAVSVTERQRFILRVRTLARAVAEAYRESREALGFPLLKHAAPASGA